MNDFIIRLQEEKNELHSKQLRLRAFLKSEKAAELTEKERFALRLQSKAMADYYGILNQRLYFYETGEWPFENLQ